ncbi:MAG: 50S ribosomal protein L30 [Candidatus Aminicenantaceae bacterium]
MAVNKTQAAAQPQAVKKPKEKQLRIRLVRSVIGRPQKQREVVKGLGLRRIDSQVVRQDRPEIRGMINKIPHLLEVEELD